MSCLLPRKKAQEREKNKVAEKGMDLCFIFVFRPSPDWIKGKVRVVCNRVIFCRRCARGGNISDVRWSPSVVFYSPFVRPANRSLSISQGRRRRKKGRKAKDTEERETPAAIFERTIIEREDERGAGEKFAELFLQKKRHGYTWLLLSAMRFLAGGPSCSNLATLPSCKKIA